MSGKQQQQQHYMDDECDITPYCTHVSDIDHIQFDLTRLKLHLLWLTNGYNLPREWRDGHTFTSVYVDELPTHTTIALQLVTSITKSNKRTSDDEHD
ncbi:hypothetical protein WN51_08660 [Melipona quadrifasciata]|uniref:Uncharacterized protein n=1 Tax=Melipona quadrifasciata TaxID=166423 RepID=A0A0N0U6U8_9HYME|nr:hypothetical protein WN51_08660 [Melipona quadrifasciata]